MTMNIFGNFIFYAQDKVKKHYLNNNIHKLYGKDFSIISSNCWGGILYKDLGIRYQTPFVNMFMYAPCYIKMLQNLDYYLGLDLKFVSKSKYFSHIPSYPIGVLDGEEVHFIHYLNPEDVLAKWNERLKRLNNKKLIIVLSERDLCMPDHIKAFDDLNYKNKICFTVNRYKLNSTVQLRGLAWNKELPPADQIAGFSYKALNIVSYLNNVCDT